MTKIKVSINDNSTGKPRVGALDTNTDKVKLSDGREMDSKDVTKVFGKDKPKK